MPDGTSKGALSGVLETGVSQHRMGVWPLVGADEMQALDRLTIESKNIPGELLMESAGRALVRPVLELLASSGRTQHPIRAFCGAGNNGGDGFVLVRHLCAEGIAAEAILVGDPDRLPSDAAANWRRLAALDLSCRVVDPERADTDWDRLLAESSVAVDALFGTGLSREIGGGFVRLIESMATAHADGLPTLAVDLPSGISADTGAILGCAVQADRTVSLSLPKTGLALEPGRTHAGSIEVARIGILDPDPERVPRVELWSERAAGLRFPDRPRSGHKGRFGHVLVVAGSMGMMGAAALCARGSLRAGSGLVTLAHPVGRDADLRGLCSEVMTADVAASESGAFVCAAEKAIVELAAARDVVALGPGVGRNAETLELVRRLARSIDRPMVLDADALYGLTGQLELLAGRAHATVLTPHPGEAARLLDTDVATVNGDRVAAAREVASRSGAIVVLKGAGTVISDPLGRTLINPTGGPALAAGGTGDVLTGIVAALLAAGLPGFEAAGLAAWWHGASADRLDPRRVGFGVLATEVADGLPNCAADLIESNMRGEPDADLGLRFPGR